MELTRDQCRRLHSSGLYTLRERTYNVSNYPSGSFVLNNYYGQKTKKTADCNGVTFTYYDDEGLPNDVDKAVGEAEASFRVQALTGLYDESLDMVLVEGIWRPEADLTYFNPALGIFLWDPVRKDCTASHREITYTTNATRFFPAEEKMPGLIILENRKLHQHMALILKEPEYQCGTNVYKTQLRNVYAVVGGRLQLRELEAKYEDRFFSVVASMHHWFVSNDISRAEVLKKLLDQHCEEEAERTRAKIGKLRSANEVVPYVEGISEPGVRLSVMGDVVYAFKCSPVTVKYRPEQGCTHQIPVFFKNSTAWYVNPQDKTLVRSARSTPCTRQTPVKYHLSNRWWCIDNVTRLCGPSELPTQLEPTLGEGVANYSLQVDYLVLESRGYSEEQRKNQSKVIQHNVEVQANVNRLGQELYDRKSSMFENIFGQEGLNQLKNILSASAYKYLEDFLLAPLDRNSEVLQGTFFAAAIFGGVSLAGFYASRHGMCLMVFVCLFKPAAFLYFNYFFIVFTILEHQKNADREEAQRAKNPRSSSRLLRGIERVFFGRPYTEATSDTGHGSDGEEPDPNAARDEGGFEKRPPLAGPTAPGEEFGCNVQDDGDNYEVLDYSALGAGGDRRPQCGNTNPPDAPRPPSPRYVSCPGASQPQDHGTTRPGDSPTSPPLLPPAQTLHMPPSTPSPERSCQQENEPSDNLIEEERYSQMPPARPRVLSLQLEDQLLQEYNGPQKGGWYTRTNPGEWHCHDCNKDITVRMSDHILRHHATKMHVKNMTWRRQWFEMRRDPASEENLGQEMCEASVAADVNFHKLCHDKFRACLQKFFGQQYPSESVLRTKHLDEAYVKSINSIKAAIGDTNWFAVECDGTTDIEQRPVVNVLIRILDGTQQKPFHANTVYLDAPENSENISELISNTITNYQLEPLKFRVLVSDSVSFMLKAGRELKAGGYPNMTQICCLAHGLHRVCETVKQLFVRTNSLISSCKKIFRKAPKRLKVFTQNYPHLATPPLPIATRWGTWLMAAVYYKKHFHQVKDVIERLANMGGQQHSDTEDNASRAKISSAITEAKTLLEAPETLLELEFIEQYLSFINFSIKELEKGGKKCLSVLQQVEVWDQARERLVAIPEEADIFAVKEELITKFDAVAERNVGLPTMRKVLDLLATPYGHMARDPLPMTVEEARALRYCPLVNVECERSFSFYKAFLADNRRSFKPESIHKYMVIHFWFNRDEDNAGQQGPAPGVPPPGDDNDNDSQQPPQSATSNRVRLQRLRPSNTPTLGLGMAERPTLSQDDQPSTRRRRITLDPAPWNPPSRPTPTEQVAPSINILGATEEEKKFLAKCKDLRLSNQQVSTVFRQYRKMQEVDMGLCDLGQGQNRCPRKTPPGPCSIDTEQSLPCCHLFAVRRFNNEEILTNVMVIAAPRERLPATRPVSPRQPPSNKNTQPRPESPATKLARNLLRLKTTGGRTTAGQGVPDVLSSQRADDSDNSDKDSDGDEGTPRQVRTPRQLPATSGAVASGRSYDQETMPAGEQPQPGTSGAPRTRAARQSPAASSKGGPRLRKTIDDHLVTEVTRAGVAVLQLLGPCSQERWVAETMDRVGTSLKRHVAESKATFTPTEMLAEILVLGIRQRHWVLKDGKIQLSRATK